MKNVNLFSVKMHCYSIRCPVSGTIPHFLTIFDTIQHYLALFCNIPSEEFELTANSLGAHTETHGGLILRTLSYLRVN